MSDAAFYWIGVGVVGAAKGGLLLFAVLYLYVRFLYDRFQLIFFRKTERRLSIASWYNARLMTDKHFCADDFPVSKRPFLLSYRFGQRRLFFMAGILEARRDSPINGQHPEEDWNRP